MAGPAETTPGRFPRRMGRDPRTRLRRLQPVGVRDSEALDSHGFFDCASSRVALLTLATACPQGTARSTKLRRTQLVFHDLEAL